MKFKNLLWNQIRKSILIYCASIIIVSIGIYSGMIAYLKHRQLTDSMKIAAHTIYEAMDGGDWMLALSHLMQLEKQSLLFDIKLIDNRDKQQNITGPFGQKSFGLWSLCQKQSVENNVYLNACTVVYGSSEISTIIIFILLVLLTFVISFKILVGKTYIFINQISDELQSIPINSSDTLDQVNEVEEITSIRQYIALLLHKAKEASHALAFKQVGTQVAHDIRSPLAALDVAMKNTSDLVEEKRIMVRGAIKRIHDIAENLLNHDFKKDEQQYCMLLPILDSVLLEKKVQYLDSNIQLNLEVDNYVYGTTIFVVPNKLKRVISNIINNSIEAIGEAQGSVVIHVSIDQDAVNITIKDDGLGFPAEILNQVFNEKVSYGKNSGHGYGLYYAKSVLQSWDGDITIASNYPVGTMVNVSLPFVKKPKWFAEKISIMANTIVVIVDDDPSIHQVWEHRFKELANNEISLIHIYSIKHFVEWMEVNRYEKNSYFYLMDYEFCNKAETGLDLIIKYDLVNQSRLVTSRHDEKHILTKCIDHNIYVIPKSLTPFVPICIECRQYYDAVLIDNDQLIHHVWLYSANEYNKKIRVFINHDDFFKHSHEISYDSVIYIDSYLNDGMRGEDIAREINKSGYTNIILTTGAKLNFIEMSNDAISGHIGKSPPWE